MLLMLLALVAIPAANALAAQPSVAITEPLDGSFTGSAPLFSGTTSAPFGGFVTLEIYAGSSASGSPVQQQFAPPFLEGTWEVAAEPLAPGEYTAVAEQTIEGETGSAQVTFTVDTKKPVVSLDPVPTPSKDTMPTLEGSAGTEPGDESGVLVTIYRGGSASGSIVQETQVQASGASWSSTAETLPDGEYTAQATQRDQAGNVGASLPVTFVVDTKAPVVTLNALSPPRTKNTKPTLTGADGVLAGDVGAVTVTIYSGPVADGTVAASGKALISGSSWSYTTSPALAQGEYTAIATQEDTAENVGKSAPITFTIDTTAPIVTINAPPARTDETKTKLTGSLGMLPGDEASVTVAIYKGSAAEGTPASSGKATVSGASWSYTPTSPLAEGTYTAQAAQEDTAGNLGKSPPVTFIVDTKAPVVTLNALSQSRTKNTEPTLTGTDGVLAGDQGAVTVTIYAGPVADGTVAASNKAVVSGSSWSYTTSPALAQGEYTAIATQEDTAGNVGKSSPRTFTIDTTAPLVTINPPKSSTSDPTPTLTGTDGVLAGDVGAVTVTIYAGSVAEGTVAASGEATVNGSNWSYTTSTLAEGTYTAIATQEDVAENVGKSAAATFEVLLGAPAVSINPVARFTNVPEVGLSGTNGVSPQDHGVLVTIYEGESIQAEHEVETSGERPKGKESWAFTTKQLPDGTYTAQATQENAAGSTGASTPIVFTVDTRPPVATLVSPADNSVVESARPTFAGAASDEAGDSQTVFLKIYPGTSATSSPSVVFEVTRSGAGWSTGASGPVLPNGIYTAQAEQRDDAGNVGMTATMTFAVAAPAAPSPNVSAPPATTPTASFEWVPAAPHTGEKVTLISTSSDLDSPITGFAWALSGNGSFTAGPPVLTTSFAKAGVHSVQLSVTDADGLSGVVTKQIGVTAPVVPLMQPFPIVRIAGTEHTLNVKVNLLTVLAPVGATVSVTCRGHGCPSKSENVVASSGASKNKLGTVLVTLRRFEHSLPAGVILEIKVWGSGEIGKFTRFTVRRGKLPSRLDTCLNPAGTIPIACPT